MSKSKPKTQGLTWLEHSFIAFNGSGYGDMSTPENFAESYINYSKWKHRPQGVKLAQEYYTVLLTMAEHLIETSDGAGKYTSPLRLIKFKMFCEAQDNKQKLL